MTTPPHDAQSPSGLPTTFEQLVDAFEQTSRATIELVSDLSEADFERPTPLPGWNVKDIVAHLVSLELAALGRPDPVVDVPAYDHIRNPIGAQLENGVELRRTRPGADVAAEYVDAIDERLAVLRSPATSPDQLVHSFWGERTLQFTLTMKTVDSYCHEQDLRDALGIAGNQASPAAYLWITQALRALPQVIGAKAGLPVGTTVYVDLTGPIAVRAGARVVALPGGPDGAGDSSNDEAAPAGASQPRMGKGVPISADLPTPSPTDTGTDTEADAGADAATDAGGSEVTDIRVGSHGFGRRAAGRWPTQLLDIRVKGDPEVAQRVMDAYAVTP